MLQESSPLQTLPIHLFLWVAGADNGVGVKEVETFQRLIGHSSWCRSNKLVESLDAIKKRYSETWKRYQNGSLTLDSHILRMQLTDVRRQVDGEEAKALAMDLSLLCKAIARAASGIFGIGKIRKEKRHALLVAKHLITETLMTKALNIREASLFEEQLWNSGDIQLQCVAVIDEAPAVKTFRFNALCGRKFSYKPGQFITLSAEIDGNKVNRSYTISSSPTRPDMLEITVKAIPGGLFSNWLHENVAEGIELQGNGPSGHFTCEGNTSNKYLMLSAGSGITPAISMSRWLMDRGENKDVVFFQSARHEEDILFAEEKAFIASRVDKFKPIYTLSGDAGEHWQGARGRISKEFLLDAVPDIQERQIFLCGPEPFKQTVDSILEEIGFNQEQYHYESFGGKPKKVKLDLVDSQKSTIQFADSQIKSDIAVNETILDSAEAAGVDIPSGCRSGVCGACKVKVKEGAAAMSCTDGLTAEEQESGMILACVATSKHHITVEV